MGLWFEKTAASQESEMEKGNEESLRSPSSKEISKEVPELPKGQDGVGEEYDTKIADLSSSTFGEVPSQIQPEVTLCPECGYNEMPNEQGRCNACGAQMTEVAKADTQHPTEKQVGQDKDDQLVNDITKEVEKEGTDSVQTTQNKNHLMAKLKDAYADYDPGTEQNSTSKNTAIPKEQAMEMESGLKPEYHEAAMKEHTEMCASMHPDEIATFEKHGKAAPGFEGTVKKMKHHPEITNPWALSHWMANKGYKPHE